MLYFIKIHKKNIIYIKYIKKEVVMKKRTLAFVIIIAVVILVAIVVQIILKDKSASRQDFF